MDFDLITVFWIIVIFWAVNLATKIAAGLLVNMDDAPAAQFVGRVLATLAA